MFKIFHRICFVSILLVSLPVQATTYVGIDYKFRRMGGMNANGFALNDVIGEHYSGAEIYAGYRFANDVGLSLGFEETGKISDNYVFFANQIFLNNTQAAGTSSYFTNKLRAFNFDLNGYFNFTPNLEAMGTLGLALWQSNMTGVVYNSSTSSYNIYPSHHYGLVPRINFSLQYFLYKCFGLRGSLGWEGTDLYRMDVTDIDGVRSKIRPYRQSVTAAIGLVARF